MSRLKFKGSWRSYQKRVLNELEFHLADNKLHIVAAPGAGKTILGIEVMRRLAAPALILAPTITIKNQWKQRIIENFLSEEDDLSLISDDIRNVKPITISTYQSLHSVFQTPTEQENFISNLKALGVQTLVLDEAHHLRTEWWTTLISLCDDLHDSRFKTVSLTGTPPYDVSQAEWIKYQSLCGSVDAEISVSELVKEGDLCPHQDLIYFSSLSDAEQETIQNFEKRRSKFFRYINEKSEVFYAINNSDFVNCINQSGNIDILFLNPDFTLSVISYLQSVDELNMNAKIITEFLELPVTQVPKFDYEIAQTLFDGILGKYGSFFKKNIPLIKAKLKELKLINGNKVDFTGRIDFKTLYARSSNKLNAIFNISKFEYNSLKESLREVILLDYIGKGDSEGLNIISVFKKLKPLNIKLGILTGSVVIIPDSAKSKLYDILKENNIKTENVLTVPFEQDYLRVETYGNVDIVPVITQLFHAGCIHILIGTAALLGEGWDEPSVNTLIIASVVGSFMLSNQMRGRALRIDRNNPDKTSNIWHLVSLTNLEKSPDLVVAQKRFDMFEGVSYEDCVIQNGIERLGIDTNTISLADCNSVNEIMLKHAGDRLGLFERWKQVFNKKANVTTSKIYEVAQVEENITKSKEYLTYFDRLLGNTYKSYKLNISQTEQVRFAKVIVKTLCDMAKIRTPYKDIKISHYKKDDKLFITFLNCTDIERNLFIRSFCELFYINNNRYLLKFNNNKSDRVKYLPVPEVFGLKKEYVELFADNIQSPVIKQYNCIMSIAKGIAFWTFLLTLFFSTQLIFLFGIGGCLLPFIISFIICSLLIIVVYNKSQTFKNIDIIFAKSASNSHEVLKARYSTYLTSDVKYSRIWI